MTYEQIFSRFYTMVNDASIFQMSKSDAYDIMCTWLHDAYGCPYIKQLFSSLQFNDELLELSYELVNPVDEESDKEFVLSVLSQYMVIGWMKPKVDNIINVSMIIGGKEEKRIQSNYSNNISRLDALENKLRKYIRDYRYQHNTYVEE